MRGRQNATLQSKMLLLLSPCYVVWVSVKPGPDHPYRRDGHDHERPPNASYNTLPKPRITQRSKTPPSFSPMGPIKASLPQPRRAFVSLRGATVSLGTLGLLAVHGCRLELDFQTPKALGLVVSSWLDVELLATYWADGPGRVGLQGSVEALAAEQVT